MYKFLSSHGKKFALLGTSLLPMTYLATNTLAMEELNAHPTHYHLNYTKLLEGFDAAAIRRGFQVYKEVCASCHPMRYLCYRHLVGVCFTEKQCKLEASQAMVEDGPDDNGDMILRPGKLTDCVPPPYPNDNAAKAANNGLAPPDLSLIIKAREGGGDYLLSLLTGYGHEIPPGLDIGSGQHYNPFFEGAVIGMAPPLNDGAVEYPDGTPATVTQMAADVTQFLGWASCRYMERQKQVGIYFLMWTCYFTVFMFWCKRFHWSSIATQKTTYRIRPSG